jgi:hypothetical protein
MLNIGLATAFKAYDAKQKSHRSVCAIARDGSLVVSLWEHHMGPEAGHLVARGSFDRWTGPGNDEFRANVKHAFDTNQRVRVIITSTRHTEEVERGADGSTLKKECKVRKDLVGEVFEADEARYAIRFKKAADSTAVVPANRD